MSAASVLAAATPAQAGVNTAAGYLVVYDNNVENVIPTSCDGNDFGRLVRYLQRQPKSPDLFTVQQVSNIEQLHALTRRLSAALPGTYAGVIAVREPGSMGYTSACGKRKNQQTNAVIYRTGRLQLEKSITWRSDAPYPTGPCRNLYGAAGTSQDRVVNVAARFRDTVARKDVTIASIHWPTSRWNGPACAAENIREANAAVDQLGGTLRVVAGDTNATTGQAGWWNKARGYGFRDPMAEKCGGRVCSSAYDTNGGHRIDFLLVKSGHGFSHVATIHKSATGGAYSDHLAVTAYVKY